ncbi:MAG: DUF262 domain-containing protein [Eubacteriales bacterium]
MAIIIAPQSLDTELKRLLDDVNDGIIQLPEFQRSWTWDDNHIRGIIASLSQGYPMGAVMRLQYGNENIRFKYRTIEGVKKKGVVPDFLVLDGQQRFTSMFRATYSSDPVDTKTDKGKEIQRFYYIDINACLDDTADRYDAILSIPSDRKIKNNFDRDIILDLSTRNLEFVHEMFPVNIIFDSNAREDWADGYKDYHGNTKEIKDKYKQFRSEVLDTITGYKLPVITLDKTTPREAVCKVFENVNTGGVALSVFELVTATCATYEFDLRKDWEECRDIIWGKNETLNTDVMYGVDETAFLTSITLFTSYMSAGATSCKKKDVLALSFEDYQNNKGALLEGYKLARKFLFSQYVFRQRDLPYTTQLIPLSAICAVIGKSEFDKPQTRSLLTLWYWCGIMGEMYGGANETRYANDIDDIVNAIKGNDSQNRTINGAFFSSTRLLSLQTRLSAAYKGIMALVYRESCRDFVKGTTMDIVKSMDEAPDIHHIFPEVYCIRNGLRREKWNSIINKTPLLPESNRSIGGDAPSIYCNKIMKNAQIDELQLRIHVESHLIDYDALIANEFDKYFIARAKRLLTVIENVMGKYVADKGSEQTIQQFGCSLT